MNYNVCLWFCFNEVMGSGRCGRRLEYLDNGNDCHYKEHNHVGDDQHVSELSIKFVLSDYSVDECACESAEDGEYDDDFNLKCISTRDYNVGRNICLVKQLEVVVFVERFILARKVQFK